MIDGGLRQTFKGRLPTWHWQAVETGGTGLGIPDSNYCAPGGAEGWVEFKRQDGWRIKFQPGQAAWLSRRRRAGGRAFLAVRRVCPSGPRRGAAVDQLWLFDGERAMDLTRLGLDMVASLGMWDGGPSKWDWQTISFFLTTDGAR